MKRLDEIKLRSDIIVKLEDFMGGDQSVARAARVSTGKVEIPSTDCAGLINFLMKSRHGSVFEHIVFTFYIEIPIAVARELHRHRIACISGDTIITLCDPGTGRQLRQETVSRIWEKWHVGITDSYPASRKGKNYRWNPSFSKWTAQVNVNGKIKYLGNFSTESEAEIAVQQFKEANPTWRRRILPSCKNIYARVFDEDTLAPQPGKILDVIKSGVKPVIQICTQSGRSLVCTRKHNVLTVDGWKQAHQLTDQDFLLRSGKIGIRDRSPIPPMLRRGIGVWTSSLRKILIAPIDLCYLCNEKFPREELTLDHVVPVILDLSKATDETNLKPACIPCHRIKTNGEQIYAERLGSTVAAVPDRVISITPCGKEMTYDLVIDEPWHNYLANGLIVHNSYNEMSARYTELLPHFWVPDETRKLHQTGKPGHYIYVEGTKEELLQQRAIMLASYAISWNAYKDALDNNVAKEVARYVLPVGIYTRMFMTVNARSLMNLLSLRINHENNAYPSFPMREIEQMAEQMEVIFKEKAPITWMAWNKNERVHP